MKLTLELYDTTYTVEMDTDEVCGGELQEMFDRVLIQAGYHLNTIRTSEGHYDVKWEWHNED